VEATALSDTAATGLILGGGALGCALLVLGLTVLAVRRGAREEREAKKHLPYSTPYKVPRQEQHGSTNGHRPPNSTGSGIPSTPYAPPHDEG